MYFLLGGGGNRQIEALTVIALVVNVDMSAC